MYVRIFIIVISKLRLEVAPQHKRPGFERAHGSGLLVVSHKKAPDFWDADPNGLIQCARFCFYPLVI